MGFSPAYAAIVLAAIGVGCAIRAASPPAPGLTRGQRLGVLFGAVVGAFVGAKLPWALADWNAALAGPVWWSDGKSVLFGLMGGYAGVELAKWALVVSAKTGDSFVVPVAAALGIGRLACLQAGCCYGCPTDMPWAVRFADGVPRHPTQAYELLFHLTAAAYFAQLRAAGGFRGQLFHFYLLSYFAFRFGTEFVRSEPAMALGLTFYQWWSAVFFAIIAFVAIHQSRRRAVAGAVMPGLAELGNTLT